jgi:hypothetical protein
MERVIRESDVIAESGRASGGRMFVRVIHQPTGTNRKVVGLGGRAYQDVVAELLAAVKQELMQDGWISEA